MQGTCGCGLHQPPTISKPYLMFVVGCDSSIEMEELALASFSACCAGVGELNTWGAVLRREDSIRT